MPEASAPLSLEQARDYASQIRTLATQLNVAVSNASMAGCVVSLYVDSSSDIGPHGRIPFLFVADLSYKL